MSKRHKSEKGEPGGAPASVKGSPQVAPRAGAEGAPGAGPSPQKRSAFDVVRENIEALVVAVILALIIRHFALEAFEIPTGSMAPTLYGIHAWLKCPNCSTDFNVALRSDSSGAVDVPYLPRYVYDGPCANPLCSLTLQEAPRSDAATITCGACGTRFRGQPRHYRTAAVASCPARCPICHFTYLALIEKKNQTGGHKILVDKFAFVVSDPKRWDVIVFGFDEWKNYIKRLIGLPGERIDIWDGDIYVNGKIERKSTHPYIQEVLSTKISDSDVPERGLLHHPPAWAELAPQGSGRDLARSKLAQWDQLLGRWSVNAKGDVGILEYSRGFDNYCSYNLAPWHHGIVSYPPNSGTQVGDKKIAFTLRPVASGSGPGSSDAGLSKEGLPPSWIGVEIRDRDFTFQLRLPFGQSPEALPAVIERLVTDSASEPSPMRAAHGSPLRVSTSRPFALPLDRPARVEFENVDDRVAARVDGVEILACEYDSLPDGYTAAQPPPPPSAKEERQAHYIRISVVNAQVELESIQVYRDTYYVDERPLHRSSRALWQGITLGPGEYLALGDNSPSSSDGRAWGFVPEKNLMGKAFVIFWPAWPWNFQCQRIR